MPRNRLEIPREDRLEEATEAAHRLFFDQGYERTTMSAIAKRVGVASNAIYWYFPSKDHAFKAAMEWHLNREMAILQTIPALAADPLERLLVFLDRIEEIDRMHADAQARRRQSKVVADFLDDFDAFARESIRETLARKLPGERDLDTPTDLIYTIISGAAADKRLHTRVSELVHFAIDALSQCYRVSEFVHLATEALALEPDASERHELMIQSPMPAQKVPALDR